LRQIAGGHGGIAHPPSTEPVDLPPIHRKTVVGSLQSAEPVGDVVADRLPEKYHVRRPPLLFGRDRFREANRRLQLLHRSNERIHREAERHGEVVLEGGLELGGIPPAGVEDHVPARDERRDAPEPERLELLAQTVHRHAAVAEIDPAQKRDISRHCAPGGNGPPQYAPRPGPGQGFSVCDGICLATTSRRCRPVRAPAPAGHLLPAPPPDPGEPPTYLATASAFASTTAEYGAISSK